MSSDPTTPPPWRDPYTLTALATSLLAWLFVFGPSVPRLATYFLGEEYVDHYGTQWFYWFTQESILGGTTPDTAQAFFYPYGKDVFADTGSNVLDGVAAIPFRFLLGDILGYNVFVICGLLTGAAAFGAFAWDVTRDRVAAIFAATLFGLCPYILVEIEEGRPTQALLLVPVLFLWMTWRSGSRPGWAAPVAAGLSLAICGYQYWYYAFFGGLACLLHGLWRTALPVPEAGGRARVLARHALIAAIALALTVPFAWQLAVGGSEHKVVGLLDMAKWTWYDNPPVTVEGFRVSLFTWQPFRGDAGNFVVDIDNHERFLSRMTAFPLAGLPLLLLWLWRPGRVDRGPIIAATVALALVGAGPGILVGLHNLPNPVYLEMVAHLPFLQRLWWNGRVLGFVSILFGLVCAGGLVAARHYGARAQLAVGALVTLGWGWTLYTDDLAPSPSWNGAIPAGYQCLASGPKGAIIELPFGWTQAHLYYQIAHRRPLFGGMLENNPIFTPEGTHELMTKNTWIMAVNAISKRQPSSPWTEPDKQAVRDLGYAYVVIQKDAFSIEEDPGTMHDNVARVELRRWMRRMDALAGRAVYDDARVTLYAPWGDPAPCDVQAWPKDTFATGSTETINTSGRRNKDAQILSRVFPAPPPEGGDKDAKPAAAKPQIPPSQAPPPPK